MTKAEINDLQSYFDGRRKLYNALIAIKSYQKDGSFFFNYTDGWGKNRNINLPIEPDDIIPALEKYIEGIDKQIIEISQHFEKITSHEK